MVEVTAIAVTMEIKDHEATFNNKNTTASDVILNMILTFFNTELSQLSITSYCGVVEKKQLDFLSRMKTFDL